jgi:hypothetical protein
LRLAKKINSFYNGSSSSEVEALHLTQYNKELDSSSISRETYLALPTEGARNKEILGVRRLVWLVIVFVGACGFAPDGAARVKIPFPVFKEELRIHHVVEVQLYRPEQEGGPSIIQGRFRVDAGKSNELFQCEGVVDTLLIEMIKAGGASYQIER